MGFNAMSYAIKITRGRLIWAIGSLVTIAIGSLAILSNSHGKRDLPVTAQGAKIAIERLLNRPSYSAILNGKKPEVEDIMLEVYGFPEPSEIPSRMFKFRLVGTTPDDWGLAIYDACGYVKLAGDFSGFLRKNAK